VPLFLVTYGPYWKSGGSMCLYWNENHMLKERYNIINDKTRVSEYKEDEYQLVT